MKKIWLTGLLMAFLLSACDEALLESNEQTNDESIERTEKAEETTEIKDPPNNEKNEKQVKEQVKENKKPTHTSGTTDKIPVELVRIVDGDTIKVIYDGQEHSVRYLLIDTPETSHPKLGKQPFGEEAKARNEELINSGQLYLEFDVGERFDKYNRLLAYIYVDDINVQEALLEEGLARVAYVYPPNTRHLDLYQKAENRAKEKGIGIWSIENYVSDNGFNGEQENVLSTNKTNESNSVKEQTSNNGNAEKEYFQNCTELRKVYPDGVPEGHPAYQPKMDRDKDGWACE